MLVLLYQRNITQALARFMANHPIKVQILLFKQAVCITSSSGNLSVYITVTDLTTILFALLIATIVFNISELWKCRMGESGHWHCGILMPKTMILFFNRGP